LSQEEADVGDGRTLKAQQECPSIANIRLRFAQTLSQMKTFHPGVVEEFRGKVTLLQSEKPLLGDAGALVEQLLAEVFPT